MSSISSLLDKTPAADTLASAACNHLMASCTQQQSVVMLGSQDNELSQQETVVMPYIPGDQRHTHLELLGVGVLVRCPRTLKKDGERDVLLMRMQE